MSKTPDSVTESLETLGFEDPDTLAGLIESETVDHGGQELDVTDIVQGLADTHRELEQTREGALCLAQVLKEKTLEAEAAGDVERAAAFQHLNHSAMDVCGRVEKRG